MKKVWRFFGLLVLVLAACFVSGHVFAAWFYFRQDQFFVIAFKVFGVVLIAAMLAELVGGGYERK